jgi:amidase
VGEPKGSDPTTWSATTMLAALQRRELGARELLEQHVSRHEKVTSQIHAVIKTDLERARREADAADETRSPTDTTRLPLLGLPITVKDNYDVAGMTTTIGMPWLRDNVVTRDATLVGRLRDAGAIVWGKTNVPFASYDWQTFNPTSPRTANPRDVNYGPGGSSGGSAAALAAGLTPLELGSDVAGSIRIPASVCGVVGLRPSEGLLSNHGHGALPGLAHSLRSLATPGPMARTIADLQLALTVLEGSDPHDLRAPPRLAKPAREVTDSSRLCIGWSDRVGRIAPCREVARVVEATLATLRAAGVDVVRAELDEAIDVEHALDTWGIIQGFELRAGAPFLLRAGPVASALGSLHYMMRYRGAFGRRVARGWLATPHQYFRALDERDELAARADSFLARFDAWLAPVWPIVALPHVKTGAPIQIDERRLPYGDALGAYCIPTAALGTPAVSLPAGVSERGLPIGLQLMARRWHDHDLLAVAASVERVLGGPLETCLPQQGA